MTTPPPSNGLYDKAAAALYANISSSYVPTATAWILEYYQQHHPEARGRRIPLVVDVACGTGQLSASLAEYCERLIGVDSSPHQVDMARRVNARPNVEYRVGSAAELSAHCPAGRVDLVAVGMAAHYFDTDAFYAEVRRCLRPGGVLAMVAYKTRGVRHPDPHFETIFDQLSINRPLNDSIRRFNPKLVDAYRSLYCPMHGATRREVTGYEEMTREDIRDFYLSVQFLFEGGAETVNRVVDSLPPMEKYEMILSRFGVFCRC